MSWRKIKEEARRIVTRARVIRRAPGRSRFVIQFFVSTLLKTIALRWRWLIKVQGYPLKKPLGGKATQVPERRDINEIMKILSTLLVLIFSLSSLAHRANEKEVSYTYDPFYLDVMSAQNENEVKLLKLGLRTSRQSKIKNFSSKNIKHLEKENHQMKLWRKSRYGEAPEISSPEINLSKLADMKGKEFDREFLSRLKDELQKSLALSKRAVQENFEEDIKAFSQSTLFAQEQRLKVTQDLSGEIK
jgi:uncharacterized protein (DUF305 family)